MQGFLEYVMKGGLARKMQIAQVARLLMQLFTIPRFQEQRVRAHEESEVHWTNPQSPLHNWLQRHGIRYRSGSLPPFAQGGAGRAYFLDDKVVKMSSNRVEAEVASLVKGRSDLPTPVIDVLKLGNQYAILQHHVDMNVPAQIRKAADYLTMIVDDYPDMEGYPESHVEQKRICLEILDRYGGGRELLPYMLSLLEVLIRLYRATGYKHDDAGPTNIGMHRGQVVIPDLGPNEDGGFDADQRLAGVDQARQRLGLPPRR